MDMVTQLQEHIANLEAKQSRHSVKLPKPEFFDGARSKLRGFLTQIEMQLRMNPQIANEEDKVVFVSTYLRGQAFEWFELFIREYQEKADKDQWSDTTQEIFASYTAFKKKLEQTFGDIDAIRSAERRLRRLKQTGSASVYAAEFQQIISHLDWDEDAYIAIFEDGLKDDVKDELVRIERPKTISDMVATAVRIDNRLYERYLQRKETRQWRSQGQRSFGQARRHEGRQGRPRRQPRESYSDPYGPQPMELDAARLPAEEEKRRKDNNLCFECGKAGHRARECNNRRNNAKPWARERNNGRNNARPQQLRATQDEVRPQQLRATNDKGWLVIDGSTNQERKGNSEGTFSDNTERLQEAITRATPDEYEHLKDQVTAWAAGRSDNEYRGLISAEHATEFPEIDWEDIESQGWTQYGPWNTTDSQELSDDSQDWGTGILKTPIETPGTPEIPETPPQLPGTDTTEQPQEKPPRYAIEEERFAKFQQTFGLDEDPERIRQLYKQTMSTLNDVRSELQDVLQQNNEAKADQLLRVNKHLDGVCGYLQPGSTLDRVRALQELLVEASTYENIENKCPCSSLRCACQGYARHPKHDLRTVSACYDDGCMTHAAGKVERSLEPKPLRWEKKPNWKPEYAGLWYGNRRINTEQQHLAATAWGRHMRITANIMLRPTTVMIDSGAAGNFMSPEYRNRYKI
jgi:hypothetical protein